MEYLQLDDVDRGVLRSLQEDARRATAAELGELVGVSASTVRNRIQRLEGAGVIRGYHPEIDYESANYQLPRSSSVRPPPRTGASWSTRSWESTGSSPSGSS